ncbi:hypothetical protein LOY70_22350 [Pseudomonas sp. B21-054]|uniref:hypothetical protein n=1 Tax=Pseudomonas sp. B21-054 TaxID=2895494 RepID=UPI002231D151|nr:hypothetical protein [Pseudomonas sp. B21-054]UZE16606.1 hypothetical protein LOY70_22350 [Pseudomonas sp. B21-054]
MGSGFSGADLIYVSSNDTQRRYVYLYGEAEAAIEFDLPIDLRLTAEPGYQVRFLYQPTQQASENPRVVAYFNAGAHFWTRELQTSTVSAAAEPPRDWLICDDKIDLRDEITQPRAALAFQSGLFDPAAAAGDATSEPERDQPIAQEPAWPAGPGELHFSGKALGTEISPELAEGVSVFVHLKPLELSTHEPAPEFDGGSARYWVEKDGRTYMPICRGGGAHHLTLPVAEDCGWAGGGVYTGTSAYASFTDQNEAGQAGLQVSPTDPDANDDAQPIAKTWEIRSDADDLSVNGRTATLRFESVYHAEPHEALACIVGPYKLDITGHGQPDYWPSVEEEETIDLQVTVHYAVSGNPEAGVAVDWRQEGDLLETLFTGGEGLAVFGYQPTTDATVIAVVDSPYKLEADTQAFAVKTIPTRKWAQFELSVGGTEISPEDNWRILPGQSYQLTLKPRSDSVLIGQDLAFSVDPAQKLQLEPTGDRPLPSNGLTWNITTAEEDNGDFTLRLDCIRFKQPLTLNGSVSELPALTIDEAPDAQLDPLAALETLTAVVPQYDGMHGTDKIRVTWTAATGSPAEGSHTTSPIEVGTIGRKPIALPVSLVAYSLGKSVTVRYTVTPGGGNESPPSASLNLAVKTLAPGDLQAAKPKIKQAENGGEGSELDLNGISANLTCRIGIWPLIVPGQDLWLRLKGTKADGTSPYNLNIWAPPPRGPFTSPTWTDRGYYDVSVAYSYLKELKDGSTLTLEFKVDFSKTTDEANAQTFPLRTYRVRAAMDLSAPRVKQATGTAPSQQLNPVAAKDALTVVIPEYGFQPGDQVRVTWTGTGGDGSHTTPAQALPTSREIPVPVEVLAYNLGKPVTVTYTVIRNGENHGPSAVLNLAVQTIASGDLQAARPKIRQAENGGEGTELDLNGVSANLICRIGIWPLIAPGQDLWLRLKGTKADGTSPYNLNIWAPPPWGPVASPAWTDRGYYDVSVAYSYLKELKDGSTLTIEFKVDFSKTTNESNAQTFPLRTYRVRAAMDLSAPRVKQATGTAPSQQLNPVAAKDALTVVIPEYGFQPGDQVRVTWAGTAGDGSHTTPAQALPPSREIPVPVEVLAYNLGKPVTVTYTVTRNGETSDPSAALNLAVQTIASGDLQAARPKIRQAENGGEGSELDLNSISANVTCRAGVWPLIAPDQDVWLRLKGTKFDGTSPYSLDIWAPPPRGPRTSEAWINQGYYDVSAAYSYLRELKDGSTLTMEFKADFSKTTNEANAQTFPLRTYTVKLEQVIPTLESVSDGNKEILEGGFALSTTLQLAGRANKGQKVEIFDGSGSGAVSKGEVTADRLLGLWAHVITVEEGPRRLYAKALYPVSPVFSNVRNFVVVTLPTIASLKDANDKEVPAGMLERFTASTQLKLSGQASKGRNVAIVDDWYENEVPKGQATANPLTGTWECNLTVAVGQYAFFAKALYPLDGYPSPYSGVRHVHVVPLITPTLDHVRDTDNKEVQDGDSTLSTELRLSGKASRGQTVEIFDGSGASAVSKGEVKSEILFGAWTLVITVPLGDRRLYAKSLYHSGAPVYSNVRRLTVRL